jgi:hypothetical protein
MNPEETMVENELDEATDDTLPDEIVEEEPDESEDLDSYTESEEEPAEEKQEPEPQATEPGWIKKRVEKAVNKAIAETEARMQAMFDQQMAPIREKMIEDEAQELVRSRKVADIETARELVRFRKGLPNEPVAQAAPQPRNEKGQFSNANTVKTEARIEMLQHQADRIKNNGGPDVIGEFQNNEEIKKKVIAGEMDFYDVADYLKTKKTSRRPPSPVRSPNGASGNNNPNAIDSMSDEQFERMEKKISQGARIRLTK